MDYRPILVRFRRTSWRTYDREGINVSSYYDTLLSAKDIGKGALKASFSVFQLVSLNWRVEMR